MLKKIVPSREIFLGRVSGRSLGLRRLAAVLAFFLTAPVGAQAQEAQGPAQGPAQAQTPPQPNKLDISQYKVTFEDTFRGPLDVTPSGPSKWTAHTPWNGDFGLAYFTNPGKDFPFRTGPNGLTITAKRDAGGTWRSGLLSTGDPKGGGFMQTGGYFEARMKLPGGHAVWPSFWLASPGTPTESIEIDVVEYYGDNSQEYSSTVHVWPKDKSKEHVGTGYWHKTNTQLHDRFHTYGVEVTEDFIIFYLDRVEYWRQPAPPSARAPLMILTNLALNPDPVKDLKKTPDPSVLHIDYIRAYVRK